MPRSGHESERLFTNIMKTALPLVTTLSTYNAYAHWRRSMSAHWWRSMRLVFPRGAGALSRHDIRELGNIS